MKRYKLQNGPVFLLGNEPSHNLIVLIDLNEGRSITNAAVAVCEFLVGMFGEELAEHRRIAYRDSDNHWDILKTKKRGVFSDYEPGNTELAKLCNHLVSKWTNSKV